MTYNFFKKKIQETKKMTYKKLSQIAEVFNGVRIERYEDEINGNIVKVLHNSSKENKIEYEEYKTKEINPKFYSQKNDIIINLANPENISLIKEENIVIPLNYTIIRVKPQYNPEYIYSIMKSKLFTNTIRRTMEGSRIKFTRINDLKDIKIEVLDKKKEDKYAKMMGLLNRRSQLYKKKTKLEEDYYNESIKNGLGSHYVKL